MCGHAALPAKAAQSGTEQKVSVENVANKPRGKG